MNVCLRERKSKCCVYNEKLDVCLRERKRDRERERERTNEERGRKCELRNKKWIDVGTKGA